MDDQGEKPGLGGRLKESGVLPRGDEFVLDPVTATSHSAASSASISGTEYADEKREALERWAARVDQIVSGTEAKVVTLPRARA